jgi:hypothetical protein
LRRLNGRRSCRWRFLLKCSHPGLKLWIILGGWQEHADAPHALALLRPRLAQ